MTLKKSLFALLVAVAAISMTAGTASAHLFGRGSCGSWGGSWGSRGSWGSCGSWGGNYYGGSCGSWGGYSSCGSCGSYGGYYSSYGYGYVGGGYVRVSRPVTTVVASTTPAVKTQLTLHVPAEAKVILAGVETKQTGEVRQFATSKLPAGQTWDDYKVVIEVTKDGKTLREERTIKLTGGQNQELAVDFANDSTRQVAQR